MPITFSLGLRIREIDILGISKLSWLLLLVRHLTLRRMSPSDLPTLLASSRLFMITTGAVEVDGKKQSTLDVELVS